MLEGWQEEDINIRNAIAIKRLTYSIHFPNHLLKVLSSRPTGIGMTLKCKTNVIASSCPLHGIKFSERRRRVQIDIELGLIPWSFTILLYAGCS